MVLLSFVLQTAAIGVFREYRFRPGDDHFAFGWEMGRVGRSIALGEGFSNPYGDSTGPTAWEPPLYPYLMGGVFKVFGIYSTKSGWVLLTLNCLFSALTCIPIFFIARRVFGERIAWWSAWIWALLPYEWYWAIHWVWDTTFGPLLLALIFWLSLELQERGRWKMWTAYGVLWGLVALSNPSLLSFLPFSGLWIWWRRHKNGLPSVPQVGLASVVFFVCITPWMIRNYRVFGRPVFVRDDFGLQLRLGNGPGAEGMLMAYMQPNLNVLEFRQFEQMGELKYAARCKEIAFRWIAAAPGRFAWTSVKRFIYYWAGVPKPTNSTLPFDFRDSLYLAWSVLAIWGVGRAVRKKIPGAWLFLWLVLMYPAVYYLVFPHARYRHPIEPELLILAVFLVSETEVGKKMRD
jgi:4-amino-4-deoxy-L-arabinose transferase-like glycosyltransferase